ncbi:hypothetical protein BH09VER1_BH09VER1_26590 [soil metagenome]
MPAKKAPVEVIEGKGLSIPIYHSPVISKGAKYDSYLLAYYRLGSRVRERAKTREIARARARELIDELSGSLPSDMPFSAMETKSINTAVDILAPLDIPLTEAARRVAEAERILGGRGTVEEAARAFVKQHKRAELPAITFGEVYREFMDTLATDKKPGVAKSREYHRSFRYWQDCSQRLGAAAEVFKKNQLIDVTTKAIEHFLNNLPIRVITASGVKFSGKKRKVTGRTRNNYRGAFCTLYSFARKMGYLPRGIETEAEHVLVVAENKSKAERADALQRRIYTPTEMQKILDELPDKWRSFAALGAFAGLRAAEIHRLDWRDVNFQDRIITVEKHKAKVGKRRIVRISSQLEAWLLPISKETGWACPHYSHDSTLNIEFAKARSKIAVPVVHNGHRHSFASYRLAEVKIAEEVAWEMNTSERKLKDNYLALVNDRELSEWKAVLPKVKAEKDKASEQKLSLAA